MKAETNQLLLLVLVYAAPKRWQTSRESCRAAQGKPSDSLHLKCLRKSPVQPGLGVPALTHSSFQIKCLWDTGPPQGIGEVRGPRLLRLHEGKGWSVQGRGWFSCCTVTALNKIWVSNWEPRPRSSSGRIAWSLYLSKVLKNRTLFNLKKTPVEYVDMICNW